MVIVDYYLLTTVHCTSSIVHHVFLMHFLNSFVHCFPFVIILHFAGSNNYGEFVIYKLVMNHGSYLFKFEFVPT